MNKDTLLHEIGNIQDPEIPVLTISDLGILRKITFGDTLVVTITPTYSGCPAMLHIEKEINEVALKNGFTKVEVKTVFEPAWTTDWLSESGKEKLMKYGISPPLKSSVNKRSLFSKSTDSVICPQCKSKETTMLSQFGSTACKAMYKCNSCLETFDYFKCL